VAELSYQIDVEWARRSMAEAEAKLEREHDAECEAQVRRAHVRIVAAGGASAVS
jgi:hypothetical protein